MSSERVSDRAYECCEGGPLKAKCKPCSLAVRVARSSSEPSREGDARATTGYDFVSLQRDEALARCEALTEALRELIDAGEPFVGDAFPGEQLSGTGLRLFNRWMAAMNDGRKALSPPEDRP